MLLSPASSHFTLLGTDITYLRIFKLQCNPSRNIFYDHFLSHTFQLSLHNYSDIHLWPYKPGNKMVVCEAKECSKVPVNIQCISLMVFL
jgi:hypothetical protein